MTTLDKRDIAERLARLPSDKKRNLLATLQQHGVDFSMLPIVRAPRTGPIAASHAQMRQWFLWRMAAGDTAYHMTSALRLRGALDESALRAAFEAVALRHESLRTVFRGEGDGSVSQVIRDTAVVDLEVIDLEVIDLRGLDGEGLQARQRAAIDRLTRTPFDLTAAPPWRIGLLQAGEDDHLLVIVVHHIVADGWSMQVLVRELAQAFDGRPSGEPLPIQYADHAAWQRDWLAAGERERQQAFWTALLGGEQPMLQLPADHARRADGARTAACHALVLPRELADALQRVARSRGATVFMVLLSAWQAVLARITGETDIRVGVPVAGRHRAETRDLIGLFVNTTVLRAIVHGRDTLGQLLDRTRVAVLDAQDHADLPFELLVEALRPDRSADANPLFQVAFNHLRADDAALSLRGLRVEAFPLGVEAAQFDVTLNTQEDAEGNLRASFVYAAELFEPTTMARLGAQFVAMLEALCADPTQAVGDVSLIDAASLAQLQSWGGERDTEGEVPDEPWAHAAIEAQARMTPHAIAVIGEGASLSYAELNQQANRLAHHLIDQGVRPDDRIGVALPSRPQRIVALLAVLKAGAAYMPLDLQLPTERLAACLDESRARLLIGEGDSLQTLARACGPLTPIDLATAPLDAQPAHDPEVRLHRHHLAYTLYTSGSTGRPKGVDVPHGALAMHLQAIDRVYGLTERDRLLQFAAIGFDAAGEQWMLPLLRGAALVLRPEDASLHTVRQRLVEHRVSVLYMPPAYLQPLLESLGTQKLPHVRLLIAGGEAWPQAACRQALRTLGIERAVNAYGPTETVITPTAYSVLADDIDEDTRSAYVPIGRPVGRRQAWLLDADLAPVPLGVSGELHLGGEGLARGYLGQPGLTAERFIADEGGERRYRSGDLARWNAQGQLQYLGRNDHQIKLRGQRIEPGEIEAQLLAQPGVSQAVVILRGQQLMAYVVGEPGRDTAELQAALERRLPEAMVPAVIVALDRLPLTPNGKVDRRALPELQQTAREHEAPQGEVEERLATIWADVLGLDKVGRHDHFFELGGHSLLALKLLEAIRQAGWAVQVRTLFAHPRLEAFARAIQAGQQADVAVPANGIPTEGCDRIEPSMLTLIDLDRSEIERIEQATPGGARNIQDIYPLAPLQQGMLFHHQMNPGRDVYVTLLDLAFDTRERLVDFIAAFNQVIARHDVLRTAFVWQGLDEPVQVVHRQARLDIEWAEALPDDPQIDVRQAPLMRAIAVQPSASEPRWRLRLPSHHLALDHTTLELVVDEIALLQQGRGAELGKPVPYRQFVAQSRGAVSDAEHRAHFARRLADIDETTAPFGLTDLRGTALPREAQLALPAPMAAEVRRQAQRLGVSAAALMHLAWGLVAARTSNRREVVFGTVLFGRMQAGQGAQRAVGLFINTLPLRLSLGDASVAQALAQAHERLSELLHHEHAGLALAQACSGVAKGTPLFTSLFNYRHSPPRANPQPAGVWEGIEVVGGGERTHYPLAMAVDDLGEAGFALKAQVHASLDPQRVCGLMQSAIEQVVEALAHAPERRLSTLQLVSAEELDRLRAWGTGTGAPAEAWVHDSIARHAATTPDATALVDADARMGYAALDALANRLAHALIAAGVRPGDAVGVSMARGMGLFATLLGVLKAGAAYLPLDPSYPPERLAFMAHDSGIQITLTQAWIDAALQRTADHSDPRVPLHAQHPAYILYTSGSTGVPKGVAVPHGALAMHVQAARSAYGLSPSNRALHLASISFDAAHEGWLSALCTGAALVIWEARDRAIHLLLAEIERQRVDVLTMPVAYMNELVDTLHDEGRTLPLHLFSAGGEAWTARTTERARRVIRAARIVNAYGPTETVITPTIWTASGAVRGATAPIGRPLGRRHAAVLDADMNPVPQGVTGELFLGGEGVATGYARRPGLTAERFVADEAGGRRYRTGDLAHWNAEGQLEFGGRVDHQLKIRGFRIEPGEVEARLLAQEGVRQAVVVARPGPGGARLVAYVVGAVDLPRLQRELPNHMVPGAFVVLDSLPLTPGGKLDRAALPAPEAGASGAAEEPPCGEAEAVIAAVWCEVLRVERVGRDANFFELGGDSILSMQMVARLHRRGWQLSSAQIFERQSVRALAEVIARREDESPVVQPRVRGALRDFLGAARIEEFGLDAAQIEDVYPLVPTQEGMLFHSIESMGSGLYVNQTSVTVGRLDAARFADAWRALTARHEILRTGVLWRSGMTRPLQIVYAHAEADVQLLDWREISRDDWREQDDVDARLRRFEHEELTRPIDWLQAPLARVRLLHLPDGRHRLVWTRHHLLADGWSDARLLGEWLALYAGETLPPQRAAYGDYVRWLQSRDAAADKAFWRDQLAALPGPTLLAQAVARDATSASQTGYGQRYTRLDREATAALQAFAQRERVTANTLVQAAWALLLQHHTDRTQVVFGATTAGRPPDLAGVEDMVGLFIKTLPIATAPRAEQPVGEFLRELQAGNLRARDHEHTALADIQRWVGSSGRALFDSIIVFENTPLGDALRDLGRYGLAFDRLHGRGLTGYAMDLQVLVADTTEIEYCYSRADFDDAFVDTLRAQMENLLRQFVEDAARPLGELGWADEPAQGALRRLGTGEATEADALRSTVHHLIERQAAQRPDAIALLMGDLELSYGALNRRANQLARWLVARGVRPEVRVAVAMERSLDSIVAFLAVLKAGGAYLPLDPVLPIDRLAYMVSDSGVSLVLTQRALTGALQALPAECVPIEALPLHAQADGDLARAVHADHLAYVIYTSGSTGQPKGVAVSHGPLAMHCLATARLYEMGPQSCELHFMSFSFDGAHERWLTPLCVGAGLALRSPELWTAEQAYEALRRYGATAAAFPPAYLGQIADWASLRDDAPPVELYVFGGEAMPRATYDKVCRSLKPRLLINGYGPTETVVTPLIWKSRGEPFDCAYAPIGRPVGERSIYVLDAELRLVARGAVGELYIGGYGLARGYLDRPALTADRFVANPFGATGDRLYRSGDLVRWRDDGQVEYIGRSDHQVKVRGFRIELGEIEARLREVAGVREAAVLARDGASGKQLVAYLGAEDSGREALLARVKQHLTERLPDYMLPARYAVLPRLPRGVSGKLDAAALPQGDDAAESLATFKPPRNPVEVQLAEIWQSVLGVPRVGLTDNFFELGGDSILSLQLISRVRQAGLGVEWRLRDLLRHQTIEALLAQAGAVPTPPRSEAGPMTTVDPQGRVPLGPIQAWFFDTELPQRHHFNQSMLLHANGPLDDERLRSAVRRLSLAHEALRLRFSLDDRGQWEQRVAPDAGEPPLWTREVCDAAGIEAVCQAAQRSLDLQRGPLWRVVHLRHRDGTARLLIVVHHLAVDGVSWRVLVEDFKQLYDSPASPSDSAPAERTAAFGAWTSHLHAWATSEALAAQWPYWQRQLAAAAELPCDMPGAPARRGDMVLTGLALDEATTSQLLRGAPAAHGVSIDALLLAALARTLSGWARHDGDHLITLEGHGREGEAFDIDLSRTVGWFTSAYPVRLPGDVASGEEALRRVAAALDAVPDKGIGFGVLKYLHPDAAVRGSLRGASAQIAFNYMGQFDQMQTPGSRFSVAAERRGRDQDDATPLTHRIEIVSGVRGGRLLMDWIYSGAQYRASTIEALVAAYQRELVQLLEAAARPASASA